MTSRSYASSLLTVTLLYGSLNAEQASLALPSGTPQIVVAEQSSSSSWNSYLEAFNSLWHAPHASVYGKLLGNADANQVYADRLRSFLKDLGIESSVAIKKFSPNRTALTLSLFDTKIPAIVSASGIWLNESLLANMKEAELIFELAYAAAAYNGLSLKNAAINSLIIGVPYAAWAGVNYMLYLRPSSTPAAAPSSFTKMLTKSLNAIKIATCPLLNAAAITLGQDRIIKPLRAFCAKTTEVEIIAQACTLLTNNGYAWVVEEYTDLVKAALSGDSTVARMNANVPLRELFNAVNSFLLENAKK